MNLSRPVLPPLRTGPLPRIQFCVELVGPRTVEAPAALRLADPDWHGALGRPVLWATSPADETWRPLVGHSGGSFDSLALCWDLVSPAGLLTSVAAMKLRDRAEEFANAVGRRALPLFPPDETDSRAAAASRLVERLAAGVTVHSLLPSPRPVGELVAWLEGRGLTNDRNGARVWAAPSRPPLLLATPYGEVDRFDSVREADGLTFGFSLPRCALPVEATEAAISLAREFGGTVLDEDGAPLRPEGLRREVASIVEMMRAAKLDPGDAECLKLFPED